MRWRQLLLVPILLYASWLAMLSFHEAGHVLHAWLSGGDIVGVAIPAIGFSQTYVSPNPHPQFVAWGGVMWGSLGPLAIHGLMHSLRLPGRRLIQFFAGFCLIANGAYLSLGWALDSNDSADLKALGVPAWLLAVVGLGATVAGLWLWHRLGPAMGLRQRVGAASADQSA